MWSSERGIGDRDGPVPKGGRRTGRGVAGAAEGHRPKPAAHAIGIANDGAGLRRRTSRLGVRHGCACLGLRHRRLTAHADQVALVRTVGTNRLRPLARRLLMTLRPPGVLMRARKPWDRFRLMLLGC